MEISEQELRTMIRDAIARHGGPAERPLPQSAVQPGIQGGAAHASHGLFTVVPSGDGECVIEPSVRCDHCGYCKSLGH